MEEEAAAGISQFGCHIHSEHPGLPSLVVKSRLLVNQGPLQPLIQLMQTCGVAVSCVEHLFKLPHPSSQTPYIVYAGYAVRPGVIEPRAVVIVRIRDRIIWHHEYLAHVCMQHKFRSVTVAVGILRVRPQGLVARLSGILHQIMLAAVAPSMAHVAEKG